MGIQQVTLDGGLDLVNSKQVAPPGTLRDCLNFEVGIKRGYVETKGIRAYSAGTTNDVIDPFVLFRWELLDGPPPIGNTDGLIGAMFLLEGQPIWWGPEEEVAAGKYSGKADVSFSWKAELGQYFAAFINVAGRMPIAGDQFQDIGGLGFTFAGPNLRASEFIVQNPTLVPTMLGVSSTVDGISEIIPEFDLSEKVTTGASAHPVAASPIGTKRGLFYFNAKDTLYSIMDIEERTFTAGSIEPSPGDVLRLYFNGSFPGPDYVIGVVETVVTTGGDWSAGTAVGRISFTVAGTIVGLPRGSVRTILQVSNNTTGALGQIVIGGLASSTNATLFKGGGEPFADDTKWQQMDLGSEVRFVSGASFPSVLNRVSKSAELELATTSTGWVPATVASGWTNSANATGAPNTSAATQLNQPGSFPALVVTGYGFALPARSVVLGVEVRIRRQIFANPSAIPCRDRTITLVGVTSQNKAQSTPWPQTLTDAVYGSSSDAWAASLSPEIVNSPDFGVSITPEAFSSGISTNRAIDSVEIQITYKDQSSIVYFGGPSAVTLSSLTSVGTVATGTTAAPHGLAVGNSVTIAGASPAAYNGTFTVATVPSVTTFTYAFAGGASPATGTKTFYQNFAEGRVIWYHKKTGDWGTADAEGTLTMYGLTGKVPAGVTIRTGPGGTGAVVAVTASTDEKVYLPSSQELEANNSQWEFAEGNFFGSEGTEQVFGVSGAGFAWSWDGTYLIRIRTGVEDAQDKPAHVMKHLDQLLLGYRSGSVIASDAGYPESFAAIVGGTNGVSSPISDDVVTYPVFAGGAQEIPMGDAVYGLTAMSEQAAFVGCKDSRRQIVGTVGALIQTVLDPSIGIIEYTLKNLSRPIFTDYEGVKWVDGELLSYLVSPWLIPRIQENKATTINSSGVLRAEIIRYKSQYRLFFLDKMILTITLNRGGIAQNTGNQCTFQSLPFVPAATTTGVTTGGSELIFAVPQGVAVGGNDLVPLYEADPLIVPNANLYAPAFVYQMDVGSTWDGVMAMPRFIETNSATDEGEWRTKTYDRMIVSGTCYGFAPFGVNFGVNFGDIETSTPKNINAGKTSDPGIKAFSEQYFSVSEQIKRDGYALALRFVANGDNLYGATSAQTSPFKFRPLTLQSVLLISESNAIRR
ncbi:MAG: hypothetical protein AB7O86_12195 [Porticoccaceae bacterium]